jgi:flavin reductase (DIM6/NTAB) family NADH-FMN oxidoreductase RutF
MKVVKNRVVHDVLREIPYGLYIVGIRSGNNGDFNALVVSWMTQCSFDPPLVMIAIRRGTRSYDLVKKGEAFSINLIDKRDRRLVKEMVKPADRVGDKLGKVAHVEEDTGAPILRDAFSYIECKVREIYEPGDHVVVLGEVVNAGRHRSGESLTCSDLRWHYAG